MLTGATQVREEILDDLLRLLIRRWGYFYVSARLAALKDRDSGSNVPVPGGYDEPKRHRLTAHEYVERIDVPPRKRDIMLQLARKFERREFLPTIGHVREFLERSNVRVNSLRGRTAAIPKIVEILTGLPDDSLETMLHDENYSGPSQLGPLSDAIKARGTAIRSSR
jgi:hypothetical protein